MNVKWDQVVEYQEVEFYYQNILLLVIFLDKTRCKNQYSYKIVVTASRVTM